jgi:hypothetical protein
MGIRMRSLAVSNCVGVCLTGKLSVSDGNSRILSQTTEEPG